MLEVSMFVYEVNVSSNYKVTVMHKIEITSAALVYGLSYQGCALLSFSCIFSFLYFYL